MKIALFGATGNTGLQLAEQALARGHHVTALVRDPAKLSKFANNVNFKAVKCNIMDASSLATHLQGHECKSRDSSRLKFRSPRTFMNKLRNSHRSMV